MSSSCRRIRCIRPVSSSVVRTKLHLQAQATVEFDRGGCISSINIRVKESVPKVQAKERWKTPSNSAKRAPWELGVGVVGAGVVGARVVGAGVVGACVVGAGVVGAGVVGAGVVGAGVVGAGVVGAGVVGAVDVKSQQCHTRFMGQTHRNHEQGRVSRCKTNNQAMYGHTTGRSRANDSGHSMREGTEYQTQPC